MFINPQTHDLAAKSKHHSWYCVIQNSSIAKIVWQLGSARAKRLLVLLLLRCWGFSCVFRCATNRRDLTLDVFHETWRTSQTSLLDLDLDQVLVLSSVDEYEDRGWGGGGVQTADWMVRLHACWTCLAGALNFFTDYCTYTHVALFFNEVVSVLCSD